MGFLHPAAASAELSAEAASVAAAAASVAVYNCVSKCYGSIIMRDQARNDLSKDQSLVTYSTGLHIGGDIISNSVLFWSVSV